MIVNHIQSWEHIELSISSSILKEIPRLIATSVYRWFFSLCVS